MKIVMKITQINVSSTEYSLWIWLRLKDEEINNILENKLNRFDIHFL